MISNEQIKARFAKARTAQEAGRLDEAAAGYKKLIKQAPKLAEAYFNLAEIQARRNVFADAARNFEAALKLRPAEPAIWTSYLQLAERHPNHDNLAKLVKRSAPVIGKSAAHEFFSGLVASRAEDAMSAAPLFKSAISKGFAAPRARVEYAAVLGKLERNEEALSQLEQALAAQPNNDYALANKAELLRDMGRFDDALAACRAAIERSPNSAPLYYTYCSIRKVQPEDPIVPKMEALIKTSKLGDDAKVFVGHALAKAMEDTGQTNKVFGYLKLANDSNARVSSFDINSDRDRVKDIQDTYLRLSKTGVTVPDPTDSAPIFVTGLPRSGTTLVEQILSSAPDVSGGGEMAILIKMLSTAWRDYAEGGRNPDAFGAGLAQLGHNFAAETKRRFPEATRVTDNSISTYTQIGFVRWAIPNAKFIVVRRDPADNALSIYKNLFAAGGHSYSTKLEGIAQFMRLFEQQVDFWRQHCPDDFYEIRYEDLISDRETQIKKLVEAAGLEWSPSFLESHKNTRKVSTLSVAQVRQPIYTSSLAAWKNYAVELAPFFAEYEKLDPAK